MKRGKIILLVLGLFLVLSIFSSALVSSIGDNNQAALPTMKFGGDIFNKLANSWQTGILDPMLLKGILAVIIVFIIFSAFTSIQFPEQPIVRLILSIVIGFLSSVFIVPEEIYAVMSSYASLGIAITFFVPLFVLMAITFFSYKSGSSFGVFISRMLWLIFGVYFLFLALGVFAVHYSGIDSKTINDSFVFDAKTKLFTGLDQAKAEELVKKSTNYFSEFFMSLMTESQFFRAFKTGIFMGFIMVIISGFAIFVALSKSIEAYVRGWVKRSLLENYLTDLELAHESDKAKANIVKGKKNT